MGCGSILTGVSGEIKIFRHGWGRGSCKNIAYHVASNAHLLGAMKNTKGGFFATMKGEGNSCGNVRLGKELEKGTVRRVTCIIIRQNATKKQWGETISKEKKGFPRYQKKTHQPIAHKTKPNQGLPSPLFPSPWGGRKPQRLTASGHARRKEVPALREYMNLKPW